MKKMKDSGIPWIGDIPEGWDVTPIAYAFSENKDRNTNNAVTEAFSFRYGGLASKQGVGKQDEIDETYSKYQVVHPGMIMINGLNLSFDFVTQRIAIVKEPGIITSTYIGIKPTPLVDSPFMAYLFKAYDYCKAFHSMGRGLRATLAYNELKKYFVIYPPLPTQQRIADYLDRKCTKIDETIEREKHVIEKLKVYKQSVITEAVTKGLNPNVPMKESGIEWIGEIPEHQQVSRVGMFYTSVLGKMVSSVRRNPDETLEKYLCAVNVHFDGIDLGHVKKMWFTPREKDQYELQDGDLLVVEGGAGAGGTYLYSGDHQEKLYIQNSIHRVRPIGSSLNQYLYYWLFSLVSRNYIDVISNTATIPHFTKAKLLNVPIVVCSADEQRQITDFLDKKCAGVDTAIAKKEALIERLAAYKKSLIYECVTGKKEVV